MELEPRLMFDGAALANIVEATSAEGENEAASEKPARDSQSSQSMPEDAGSREVADDHQSVTNALVALGAPAAGYEAPRQVVIIDGGISDVDGILKAVPANADVYVLPTDRNGVAIIADILSQYEDLDAVHLVSHGKDGGVMLGASTLDAVNVTDHADALSRWGSALGENGDILLYGCATGSGVEGVVFLQTLAELTGADIAASDDATGATERGGDWVLERSTGVIDVDPLEAGAFYGLLVTTPVDGRSDFGARYNFDSFNNPYSSSFTSENINDLGWIAKITPSAGQRAYLMVDDGGQLIWGGVDTSAQKAKIGAMSLHTASGENIDLLQLKFDTGYAATVTLTGYRDGLAVSGYSETVSVPFGGATAVLAWENVDEIRFSISNYPDKQSQVFSISEIMTGPVPSLTGALQAASNTLEEGADGPLALGDLLFSHNGVPSTNLTISANGGIMSAVSSGNVTVAGSGTNTLILSGSATDIDAWLNSSTNITYNSGALSGGGALELSFSTNYEGVVLDLGTKTVDVTEVDQQARFKALPDSFSGRVGIAKVLDFSDADLIDADSDNETFQFTMSVDTGTLNISGGSISGLTVTGNGTDTLVFSGRPSRVEAWFDSTTRKITYTGVAEGTAVLTLRGTDTGPYSIGTVDIDVAPANTAPTVSGVPAVVTLTEDTSGVLDLSGLVISDPDSSGPFTITIQNSLLDIGATSADGVSVSTMSGGRSVSLTGTIAALTAFLADANRVTLTPQPNGNGTNYATITLSVDDGDDNIVTNTIRADVTPVDDPSSITGETGPLYATEDTTTGLKLSNLTLVDVDQGDQTVILTVDRGTLTMAAVSQLTVTGNGTNRLTVTGSVFNLNSRLLDLSSSYLRYTPEADLFGTAADALTISAPGAAGGEDVVLRRIDIDISAVNDAPTLTGLPSSVTIPENQATPLDLSALVLSDIDSSGPGFRLSLSAIFGGYLSATSTDRVTITGSGTKSLVVSGSISDIQAWLSSGTPISFQARPNVSGTTADRIMFTGNDGDGGAANFGAVTINVDPSTEADVPTLSDAPNKFNAIEETTATFDLSGVTLTNGGAAPTATMTLEFSVGHGVLAVPPSGSVTVAGSGTNTLAITGSFTEISAWLASASAVTYTPDVDVAGFNADALAIRITDGAGADRTSIGSVTISITNVNDAPAPTGFPTTITAAVNTVVALDLADLKLNDPDAAIFSPAPGNLTAVLSVTGGTLNYVGGPPGFVVSGAGTDTLTLTAPIKTIEAFLNSGRVTYSPPADAYGPGIATLTLVVNDNAGSGDVDAGSATVNVKPPNAAPTLTGLPSSVSGDEDSAFTVDLSGATLSDVDSPGADFVLTLTADAGTLAATSTGGVTVNGSGTGTLTLTGSVAAIGTFLTNASAIQYTGAANAYGTAVATLTLTGDDGDGNSDVALGTVDIDITNVNDPAGADSLPSKVTATEDEKSGLDLSGVILSTIDPLDATHKLVLSVDKGTLYASNSGGVSVAGTGTGTLTLTGGRDVIQAWLGVNGNVSYQGTENLNGTAAATMTLKADDMDGGGQVTLGTVAIDITPVNDNPASTGFPTTVTAVENTTGSLDLSGLKLNDPDSPDNFTVSLRVAHGTLGFSGADPAFTITGKGTAVLSLTGTLAEVEAFLNSGRVTYTPATDALGSGVDTLTFSVDDTDGSGSLQQGSATIDVKPPNAAPTLTGLPDTVTVKEDTASPIDLSGVTLADSDSPGADFYITLGADKGILTAVSSGGVTVAGSGTGKLTLTGTVTAIDAFLSNSTAIKYTGAENAYGTAAATLTVKASDGDGNSDVALGTVDIDITNVNDPAGADSLPSKVTATEDEKSGLDLSGVILSTIDPLDATHKLVLSVDKGTLYASNSGGVSVAGTGTGTLTLTGGRDVIQAWLGVNGNVSYQGTENLNGTAAATMTLKADDMDGGGQVTLGTVAIDITPVNDNPASTGFPTTVTAVENTTGSLDLSGLKLNDPDSPDNFTVSLRVAHGTLGFSGADPAFTITGKGTAVLSLTGTLAEVEAFLNSGRVTYTPATDALGSGVDTLTFSVDDTDGSGSLQQGSATIDVKPPNAAPTLTGLPDTVTVKEDTASPIDLSGVTLADSDSPGADFYITLVAGDGTLAAVSSGGVTVTGSGTGTLTLTGTVTAIDAFLNATDAITYTSAENAYGVDKDRISIVANDGDMPAEVSLGAMQVDITPVNDAPKVSDLPARIGATEDTAVGVDLTGMSLTDVDPADDDFQLVLAVAHGTLSAQTTGGVTVLGSGTGTLTLSGSLVAIRAWLQDSSAVTFTGALHAEGKDADTLTVKADDMDGSGLVSQGTIAIDITGVNDAPTIADLPPITKTYSGEDSPVSFPSVVINDVDGGSGIFTVAISSDTGALSATSVDGVSVGGSGSNRLVLTGTMGDINAFLSQSRVAFNSGAGVTGESTLSLVVNDGNGGVASAVMRLDTQVRQTPQTSDTDPRSQQNDSRPGTSPVFRLTLPEETDTPILSSLQTMGAGYNGQLRSPVLGQLGAVSPLDTSGTPVRQAIRQQGGPASAEGEASPLGFAGLRMGGLQGRVGFNGLGALGETPRFEDMGDNDPGGIAPDLGAPLGEGLPDGEPAQAGARTETALDTRVEGHVGLTRQMSAAAVDAKAPVTSVTQALEALADTLRT
jgi:hypothetical protein